MLGDAGLFPDVGLGSSLSFDAPAAPPSLIFPDDFAGAPVQAGRPDQWGAISVPVPAQFAGYPVGDPALKYILDFFVAFLVTDANVTAAWAGSKLAGQFPAVNKSFAFDPREVVFNEKDLPSLFLWRESATQERIAEDWLVETTMLRLLWVLPISTRDGYRNLVSFENAIVKALVVGLERQRTPGFVVAGDTDPNAATLGSQLDRFAQYMSLVFTSWKRAHVSLSMGASMPRSYESVEMTLTMQENLVYGADNFYALDVANGGYLTIANEAGDITDQGPI
jgi:hypothetical protein